MLLRSLRRPGREAIIPAVLAFISLLIVTFSYRQPAAADKLAGCLMSMVTPFERGAEWLSSRVTDWSSGLLAMGKLPRENERLREEVNKLKAEVLQARQLEDDVEELRRLLRFREKLGSRHRLAKALGAEVIGRDSTSWYRTVRIDRGTAHGVRKNDPVLTYEGLVGRVFRTSRSSSQVMLILDDQSGVGGLVERTRAVGVVLGTGQDLCEMAYLSPRADVKEDDSVISSGLGGIYPKGLPIGKIVSVSHEGYVQSAVLEPRVEFSRLEKVFVLTSKTADRRRGTPREEGDPM